MARSRAAPTPSRVWPPRRASVPDTLRIVCCIVLPTWSKGLFFRSRRMMRLAQRWDLDALAVRTMVSLRHRYGEGLLRLANPIKSQVLVLAWDDAARILAGEPRPFATASRSKQIALAHFEPRTSLITRSAERAPRRAFNERVLDSGRPIHRCADDFRPIVADEAARLRGICGEALRWEPFAEAWSRGMRRLVLGSAATDDRELTEMLARLRRDANWVWLRRDRKRLRRRFHARLADHLARAEPGSLAAMVTRRDAEQARPLDQVTQWLFAFDAGAIATWRALALIATHPHERAQALADAAAAADAADAADAEGTSERAYLRACFLEALRLWPTTPLILRETLSEVSFDGITLAAGTELLVFAPYFHRDRARVPDADRFAPAIWLGNDPAGVSPFVPFSGGPAACPGRHLVSMLASVWLAALLEGSAPMALIGAPPLGPAMPLPGTLDHFQLRFQVGSGQRAEPV
ncbi:MAG TPA: cytochrome P450 [Xanthobacteraceae bacterium]|nr:cytochrome P450 [Xanthobacteraceae bacterium]